MNEDQTDAENSKEAGNEAGGSANSAGGDAPRNASRRKAFPVKSDYDVGYCRPPEASQFKPGQSGNPKGRPKGSRNIGTFLEKALMTPVSITVGGQKRKSTMIEATIMQIASAATKGDHVAIRQLFELASRYSVLNEPEAAGAKAMDEEVIKTTLAAALARLKHAAPAADPDKPADPPSEDGTSSHDDAQVP